MQRLHCTRHCHRHQQSQVHERSRPAAAAAAAASAPLRPSHVRRSRQQRCHVSAMFTGIVQGLATVQQVTEAPGARTFRIELPAGRAAGVAIGASVAINGTCLTVTAIDGDTLSFDVMAETLRATSLGNLQTGARVNYERSARVGDEIGGHTVSGHVHTTATIVDVAESPNNRRLTFELPAPAAAAGSSSSDAESAAAETAAPGWWGGSTGPGSSGDLMRYVLPKGFIAVDGCSLTVGEVDAAARRFCVYLIPETLRVTTFGFKGVGDDVNIEVEAQTQAIVDTVERVLAQYLQQQGGAGASGAAGGAGGLLPGLVGAGGGGGGVAAAADVAAPGSS